MEKQTTKPTLADYAQHMINQPCKIHMELCNGKINGYNMRFGAFSCTWGKKDNGYVIPVNLTPLLITYDQLADEQWEALQQLNPFKAHGRLKSFVLQSLNLGVSRLLSWNPEQFQLLIEWGVDIFDLIGKGLAERREAA